MWSVRGGQQEAAFRPDWNFGQVQLDGGSAGDDDGTALVLQGRASNGGFAVDDVFVYDGRCPSESETS